MSQSWLVPVLAGDKVSAALLSKVNDALEALRTVHSGASTPSSTVAYMLHVDTATGDVMQRNAADAASAAILAANAKNHQDEPQIRVPGVAGSINMPLFAPGQAWKALELVILSDTTTAGSDGANNWAFDVQKITGGAVSLYSTVPDTNGAGPSPGELTLQVAWKAAMDQNQVLSADDFLELQITETGGPTSLAAALLVFVIRGTLIGV